MASAPTSSYAGSAAGEGDGVVTYGEAFTVQPFGNILQTVSSPAPSSRTRWSSSGRGAPGRPAAVSDPDVHLLAGAGRRYERRHESGHQRYPGRSRASYRVTINSFLQGGGDGFSEFTKGTNIIGGGIDLDAFDAYLDAHPNQGPPALGRITKGCRTADRT